MSETAIRPGKRANGALSVWQGFWQFYRIRPIPGLDLNAGSGTISFNDLFQEFAAEWRVLLTGTLLGLLVAILLVIGERPTYQASLTLAAAEASMSDPNGGSNSTTSSVLGIFGKGAGQFDDYAQFLSTTHSVRLAKRLDEKYGLMKEVFPTDRKTGAFIPPPGMVPRLSRAIRWTLGLQPWAPPNMVSLADFLKGSVEIVSQADGTTQLIHYSSTPEQASEFLARIYHETDDLMRQEKLASHRSRLNYLAQRLTDIQSLEQRNFLINLWGREQSQMLLLTGGDPVGARMTDDIYVPNMPQNGAALKIAMGFALGLIVALFVVIGRSAYRRA